ALLLPVVLRSGFHGGVDLMIFPAFALALSFGVAAQRFVRSEGAARSGALLVSCVLVVSWADASRGRGAWEAWRSGLAGGEGLAARGTSRYAHGPVPLSLLQESMRGGARAAHVLTNAWEIHPVFGAYVDRGFLPS